MEDPAFEVQPEINVLFPKSTLLSIFLPSVKPPSPLALRNMTDCSSSSSEEPLQTYRPLKLLLWNLASALPRANSSRANATPDKTNAFRMIFILSLKGSFSSCSSQPSLTPRWTFSNREGHARLIGECPTDGECPHCVAVLVQAPRPGSSSNPLLLPSITMVTPPWARTKFH